MAGIVAAVAIHGALPSSRGKAPRRSGHAADVAPHPQRNVSAPVYWIRGIVLLLIILLMLWLIYRTFTGMEAPMISIAFPAGKP